MHIHIIPPLGTWDPPPAIPPPNFSIEINILVLHLPNIELKQYRLEIPFKPYINSYQTIDKLINIDRFHRVHCTLVLAYIAWGETVKPADGIGLQKIGHSKKN